MIIPMYNKDEKIYSHIMTITGDKNDLNSGVYSIHINDTYTASMYPIV